MRARVATALVVAVVGLCFGALVPTPYLILAPGNALDLRDRVRVHGYGAPADDVLMTDVLVHRATLVELLARGLPDLRFVPAAHLIPQGLSAGEYDRVLSEAMTRSQLTGAYVAERAAGLDPRSPQLAVIVEAIAPDVPAAAVLRPGDRVLALDGRAVPDAESLGRILAVAGANRPLAVRVERHGRIAQLRTRAIVRGGSVRLGVDVRERYIAPRLPAAVDFDVGDVAGSSGGLMFALAVYEALHPTSSRPPITIAGTGTIARDGRVGPIEGVRQKLIVAERAGASVFLVPRQNFDDVAGHREIEIVPVDTFADALRAVRTGR